jgi:hypothetical protein
MDKGFENRANLRQDSVPRMSFGASARPKSILGNANDLPRSTKADFIPPRDRMDVVARIEPSLHRINLPLCQ